MLNYLVVLDGWQQVFVHLVGKGQDLSMANGRPDGQVHAAAVNHQVDEHDLATGEGIGTELSN